MQNNKMFTIITPTFNSEKTIERTLKSVLSQTYKNFEYLIIDGKSTDNTLNIIKSYETKFENKLKVFSEPDSGIYDAMNKGIKKASGELIGIVNSDDFYEPDTLENVFKSYDFDSKYQILYGFERITSGGVEKAVVIYNHRFLDEKMITHPTCFISKNIYEDLGLYDTQFKSSADYEFMLRIFHSDNKVMFTPVYRVISNFELGGMSSTEISVRETAFLRRNYGIINTKKYLVIVLRSYIHSLFTVKNKF